MFDWSWIVTDGRSVLMVFLSVVGVYAAMLLYTRISGLRSFSKMSTTDFAVTVAMGSVIASVIVAREPPLLQGALALAALYLIQYVVAKLRTVSSGVQWVVENRPLLLMSGSEVIEENLRRARVTRGDLRAKLREANVHHTSQVRAVVMETTGDISVLHGEGPELEDEILADVRGAERLRPSGGGQ